MRPTHEMEDTIDYLMGLRVVLTEHGDLVFFNSSGKVLMRFDGTSYRANMSPGTPEESLR